MKYTFEPTRSYGLNSVLDKKYPEVIPTVTPITLVPTNYSPHSFGGASFPFQCNIPSKINSFSGTS